MLEIIRGDDTTLEFTFKDVDGSAIDLTGSEVFFTVKKNAKDLDADAVVIKDWVFPGDGSDGVLEFTLTSEDTDLDTRAYSYDIQIKDSDGYIFSSSSGKLKVLRDITIREEIVI